MIENEKHVTVLKLLKLLTFSDKEKLPEAVPLWKTEIDSLKLPESTNRMLIELLENAILSCFLKLTIKVIRLTPLDKTVAGKELIMMGVEQGRLEAELRIA
jgi:hypothetical protein